MDDQTSPQPAAAAASGEGGWIVFTICSERFALPMATVEAVALPPHLARVPHASGALLGVGNLGGQVMPVLDFARLLGRQRGVRAYDGGGEIIRLRIPGSSVGIWVDRVERLARIDPKMMAEPAGDEMSAATGPDLTGVRLIDPTALLVAALDPPTLASGAPAPLGEIAGQVLPAAAPAIAEPYILVEVAGRRVLLRREAVVELAEPVPWTRLPRAPAGFCGVGVLRGAALPILSLATLLGRPEPAAPGGFAVVGIQGCRALVAIDRVVGLRLGREPGRHLSDAASPEPFTEDGAPIDLATAISDELRRIVIGFSQLGEGQRSADSATSDPATEYLTFGLAGQAFAVPIAVVDRVVGGQPLIKLPRPTDDAKGFAPIAGAIELRGQIVPVAGLQSRLGLIGDHGRPDALEASAYVILRGIDGLGAIGVEKIEGVMALRPGDIAPPPAEHELIEGVVAMAAGRLLRIIAPAQLWREGG